MKDIADPSEHYTPPPPPTPNPLLSPYLDHYTNILGTSTDQTQTYLQTLSAHNIHYNPLHHESELLKIRQIRASQNHQAVLLQIELGPFTLPVSLLNRKQRSLTHQCLQLGKGASGTIYETEWAHSPLVIKCMLCNYTSKTSPLLLALQQYAFCKIAAALQTGPQMPTLLGFDLVCYDQCIEFTMQKCHPVTKMTRKDAQSLREQLRALHHFRIVHLDIKPSNLALSSSLNKPILLDYGLSKRIKEQAGQLKMFSFTGTLGYCCEDMRKLYFEEGRGWVDLYFNDAHCLKLTFAFYEAESRISERNREALQQYMMSDDDESIQGEILRQGWQAVNSVSGQLIFIWFQYQTFMGVHQPLSQPLPPNFPSDYSNQASTYLLSLPPTPSTRTLTSLLFPHLEQTHPLLHKHFTKPHFNHPTDEDNPPPSFSTRLENIINYQMEQIYHKDWRQENGPLLKNRLLAGEKKFESELEYFHRVLSYIAFNRLKQNNTIKDKQEVLEKFVSTYLTETKTPQFWDLLDKTLNFLLQYCLSPYDPSKTFLLLNTIEQQIILNCTDTQGLLSLFTSLTSLPLPSLTKLQLLTDVKRHLIWYGYRIAFRNPINLRTLQRTLQSHRKTLLKSARTEPPSLPLFNAHTFLIYLDLYPLNIRQLHPHLLDKHPFTHPQQQWIQLNAYTQVIHTLSTKWGRTSPYESSQLLNLIQERGSDIFDSYCLVLAFQYHVANDRAMFQQLTRPLTAQFGPISKDYVFPLMSLRMKHRRSWSDYTNYAVSLVLACDHTLKHGKCSHILLNWLVHLTLHHNHLHPHCPTPLAPTLTHLQTYTKHYVLSFTPLFLQQFDETHADLFNDHALTNYLHYLIVLKMYRFVSQLMRFIGVKVRMVGAMTQGEYSLSRARRALDVVREFRIGCFSHFGDRTATDAHLVRELRIAGGQHLTQRSQQSETDLTATLKKLALLCSPQYKPLLATLMYNHAHNNCIPLFFHEVREFLMDLLLALFDKGQLEEVKNVIVEATLYLQLHFSMENYSTLHRCVKGFLEKSGVWKNRGVLRDFARDLRRRSKEIPYLGLALGLLLEGGDVELRRGLLVSLARCMPEMPMSLTALVYRKYQVEVMKEPAVRRKKRVMSDRHALGCMEEGMARRILGRGDGRMGWAMVAMAKKYYLNTHPLLLPPKPPSSPPPSFLSTPQNQL